MTQSLEPLFAALDPKIFDQEEHWRQWASDHRDQLQVFEKLPGDASARRYFRFVSQGQSRILMVTDPFHYDVKTYQGYPYLEVQTYLQHKGIRVPKVFEILPTKGLMVIEDLGDQTLLHYLNSVTDPEVERGLYSKVIDQLIELQKKTVQDATTTKIQAFDLLFDYEKLKWEVDFTVEHFYETYLGRTIDSSSRQVLEGSFRSICETLADEPFVFCHRDFHSRNIMVKSDPGESSDPIFYFIDFQDARMGPCQYDLVSLLKDSYYQLSESQVEKLKKAYLKKAKGVIEAAQDEDRFHQIFDLMTIQRNFKAIGSFASFFNRRGDARYIKFIGNTFENIRRTLLKYPEYSNLREVLFHYYYF